MVLPEQQTQSWPSQRSSSSFRLGLVSVSITMAVATACLTAADGKDELIAGCTCLPGVQ